MAKMPQMGGLITRKGDAIPTVQPVSVEQEDVLKTPPQRKTDKSIAVTVRLDPERYERLKLHGVRQRRSNQDLLIEALDALLGAKAKP